jgi:hypothetical protein
MQIEMRASTLDFGEKIRAFKYSIFNMFSI